MPEAASRGQFCAACAVCQSGWFRDARRQDSAAACYSARGCGCGKGVGAVDACSDCPRRGGSPAVEGNAGWARKTGLHIWSGIHLIHDSLRGCEGSGNGQDLICSFPFVSNGLLFMPFWARIAYPCVSLLFYFVPVER